MDYKQDNGSSFFFVVSSALFAFMAISGIVGAFTQSSVWLAFLLFAVLSMAAFGAFRDVSHGYALETKWFSPRSGQLFSAKYYNMREEYIDMVLFDLKESKRIFCTIRKSKIPFLKGTDTLPETFIFHEVEGNNGELFYEIKETKSIAN